MTSITEFSKVCQSTNLDVETILETVSELEEWKSKSVNQLAKSVAGIVPGHRGCKLLPCKATVAGRQGFEPR